MEEGMGGLNQIDLLHVSGKDIDNDIQLTYFPDHELEYYVAFNYLYHSPSCKYSDERLHRNVSENIRVNDCPGYYEKTNLSEEAVPEIDFTECSFIQVRRDWYAPLCKREILRNYFREYPCPTMVRRLQDWFMSSPRRNRQISRFIAERLDWGDISAEKDIRNRWPLSFFHNMVLKKHESLKYLAVLNEALKVADMRFCSRNKLLIAIPLST